MVQLIISGVLLGGVYALISIGLTLIFGVLRLINFAHGEFLMLAMFGSFWLWHLFGMDPYVSILVIAPALFLLGLLVEWVLIRPTINAPHVVQVFVTLGLSIVLQNLALLFWGADFRSVRVPYASANLVLGQLIVSIPRLVAFGVSLAIALGLHLFLRYTYAGKAIRATAQDRKAARLMGINVDRVFLFTFAIGSAMVGVAGPLLVPFLNIYPTEGGELIFVAFVVVVLGGLGSVPGAIVGGLFVGLVETLSGFYISASMKQAIYFGLFILVLAFLPSGLFGQRGAEVMGAE